MAAKNKIIALKISGIKYLIKILEMKIVFFKLLSILRRLTQSSELKRLQFLSILYFPGQSKSLLIFCNNNNNPISCDVIKTRRASLLSS